MSRVLPILFNTDMVLEILDGRKTVTRRLIKSQPPYDVQCPLGYCTDGYKSEIGKFAFGSHEDGGKMIFCKPPYQQGNILYVRETWLDYAGRFMYKADCDKYRLESLKLAEFNWRPSIHMPKEAARIWLKVNDVRVERLQEITIDDIRNEGLTSMSVHAGDMVIALEEWKILWNSTIKKSDIDLYGWDANPWVWVIEFEWCEKPENF